MNRRNILENPVDYVTEENFLESPRVAEGPTSPKKYLSLGSGSGSVGSGLAPVPNIDDSSNHQMSDEDSSSGYAGEDAVLLLSDGDESTSYDSETSDYERLPPPIEIPDALKPKDVREAEAKAKKKTSCQSKLEDSSSDDSDDDSDKRQQHRRLQKETPKSAPIAKATPTKTPMKQPESSEDEDSDDDFILTVKPDLKDYHSPVKDAAEIMARLTNSQRQLATTTLDVDDSSEESSRSKETIEEEIIEEEIIEHAVVSKPKAAPAPSPRPIPPPVNRSLDNKDDDDGGEGNKDYAWEKPDWAKKGPALKSTGKDTKGYLSRPITQLPHMGKSHDAPSPAPIVTSAPAPAPASKPTPKPAAAPVTTPKPAPTPAPPLDPRPIDNNEDEDGQKQYGWEKPDWAKKGPKLRATGKADKMKAGNLAAPVTNIRDYVATEKKELDFQRPDLSKDKLLKGTKKGEALKSGGDIARPIGGIKPIDESN